jgi:hypothetical protein
MLVHMPNRALTPTWSAATSAGVGCSGVTGNTSASGARKIPQRGHPELGRMLLAAIDVASGVSRRPQEDAAHGRVQVRTVGFEQSPKAASRSDLGTSRQTGTVRPTSW